MIAEFKPSECLLLSNIIEQYQKSINDGLSKIDKMGIVTIKGPIIKVDEAEARKMYRKANTLFAIFYRGSREV